jgi:phosphotransferase system HPr (HPr) family protein
MIEKSRPLLVAEKNQKKSRQTTIINDLGLHARSAAQIAAIARNSAGNVWIQKDHEKADASSILDILALGCAKGTKITIVIEDLADRPTLNAIADLVASGFGE